MPSKRKSVLPQVRELEQVRRQLVRQARSLADYGRIDAAPFEKVGRKRSHLGLLEDVLLLTGVLRDNWSRIEGYTPLTLEFLVEQRVRAVAFMQALGLRGTTPPEFLRAVRIRQQFFTLLVRSYEQVRQALRYARRRRGDAESIAPSLYKGRVDRDVKRDARSEEVESNPQATGVPELPAPALRVPELRVPESARVGAGMGEGLERQVQSSVPLVRRSRSRRARRGRPLRAFVARSVLSSGSHLPLLSAPRGHPRG